MVSQGNYGMRLTTALLAGAMIWAGSTVAFALEGSEAPQDASAQVSTVGWTADRQLQIEILKEITNRRRLSQDDDQRRLLDELGTLYASGFEQPIWIEGSAPNQRAQQALDEFRRADEWALNPADYAFELPNDQLENAVEKARFELDFTMNVLKYVDHARHGRFRPSEMTLWFERAKDKTGELELLQQLAKSDDVGALLVAQQPQHEGFKRLRAVYLHRKFPDRFPAPHRVAEVKKPRPIFLDYGSAIRRGQRDPQIAMLRKRLKVPAAATEDSELYDRELMLAVNTFMRTQGWRRKYVYDNKVRRALNENNGDKKTRRSRSVSLDDIVANMEKWRWLPRNLGKMYVWNNLPSFQTQFVKNGKVIHQERIIVGKTDTQTPVFSDTMTHVVFKPQWGIPNSIKIKSLLPHLAGGDLDVLRRRGMQIQYEDKVVSPSHYNWSRTDIRSIPIVMGAGPSNPLGRVKFIFPNHHAVYMHDTPQKYLFKDNTRTFSHGCIRVRNPVRLAEVILGETSDWSKDMVADHLQRRAKENNRIDLVHKVPVHNVYFTVSADENGNLETLPDMYGHDRRIKQALAGKSLKLIAQSDPARRQKREMEDISNNRPTYIARNNSELQPAPGFFGANQYGLGGPTYVQAYQQPKPFKKKKYKKSTYNAFQINPYTPYSPFRGD